jgi:hypothetical protein
VIRTAVPCILLTRKRSQVQTLSRPPPFSQVKALSAASREDPLPGWAALGPRDHPCRQAQRPFRAHPLGPPGSTTTTDSGRASSQDANHAASSGKYRNGALPPAPLPGSAASEVRPHGGLASLVGQPARRRRPSTTRQVRNRHLLLTYGRPWQRRPHPGRLVPLTEPPGTRQTAGNSTHSGHQG